MPLPTLIALSLAVGCATALAGQRELRMSPRPVMLTRAAAAYAIFASLVMVPVGVYFYLFHGDWFLLYLVEASRIPSALALLSFVAIAGIGALSFWLSAALLRNQHERVVYVLTSFFGAAGVLSVALNLDRLGQVGNYAEFHGRFHLRSFGEGVLMQGTLIMDGLLLAGLVFLLARLYFVGRRA